MTLVTAMLRPLCPERLVAHRGPWDSQQDAQVSLGLLLFHLNMTDGG